MLHKNIPKNKEYVVARAYWINWNGKKERKFSQNINKNTHQITDSLKKEISNKFTNIMWEYFKNEISNK